LARDSGPCGLCQIAGMADDQRSPLADDLYDRDFYLWTQDQADAIRVAASGGLLPASLDWERLAEEVGDLGKSELRECLSRVRKILIHLWKLQATGREEPQGHWLLEILTQRTDLAAALSPSLRRLLEEKLEKLHLDAVRLASASFQADEPGALPLDASHRWTLEQILGEENDPIG